jgi:cysteine-rich repeat protein
MANAIVDGQKGFVGQICPNGDVDVYSIDVPAGASVTAAITTDGTGCPIANKVQLRLLDPTFQPVVTDVHAVGPCPNLLPSHFSQLVSLPAGTYYLEVRNLSSTPIEAYQLDASTALPGCGDGIPATTIGEQCDDGNMTDGDGCSATCQLETGSYANEVEPNDSSTMATSVDGFDGGVGAIEPAGDIDEWSVTVTVAGSSIIAKMSDGLGHCPNQGWNPEMKLLSPTGATLATDHTSGLMGCPAIMPSGYPAASNLAVGTYIVRVDSQGGTGTAHQYVVDVHASPPGCGDGVVQPGEQCDDGNTTDGDGCSSTCAFEGNLIPETEPNDQTSQANPLGAADGFLASLSSALDKDAFSFDVATAGQSVVVTVDDGVGHCPASFDARVRLFSPVGATIADFEGTTANSNGGPCVLISPGNTSGAGNLAAGTYLVYVEAAGQMPVPQYVVRIKVQAPGCGDGLIQAGEQCDDGNNVPGDGCNATCQSESPYEVEPNSTRATATALWPGTTSWIGSINPVGDVDVFVFETTTAGPITALTHTVGSATTCNFNTEIGLFDVNGTRIAVDDNTGPQNCSKIAQGMYPQVANLPAGTYYIAVTQASNTAVIPKYQLDITLP